MSVAYQTATQQSRKAEIRALVVSRLNQALEETDRLARVGTLTATNDQLFNQTLKGLPVSFNVDVTVDSTVARGDVFQVVGLATWTDGRAERVRIATRVVRRLSQQRVGIKFSPVTNPPLASQSSAGYYVQRRWTVLQSANGSEPVLDNSGLASPIRVLVTGGVIGPTGGPYVSGVNPTIPGIYDSGFIDAGSGRMQATVSNIPFARYDLVVYLNFSTGPTTTGGWVESGAIRLPVAPIDRINLFGPASRHVQGINMMLLPNLTGSTQSFATVGSPAPVIHAIQVVQRP